MFFDIFCSVSEMFFPLSFDNLTNITVYLPTGHCTGPGTPSCLNVIIAAIFVVQSGQTPLLRAAIYGQIKALAILIKAGSDVNIKDSVR